MPGRTAATLDSATHLIWPESAFPFLLHREPGALAQIASILRPGPILVTGAARMEEPLPGEAVGPFFNAIQTVDDHGTILGAYDKVHLVPFGEYLPQPLEALIRAVGLQALRQHPGRLRGRRSAPDPRGPRPCRRSPRQSATRRFFPTTSCPTARGPI